MLINLVNHAATVWTNNIPYYTGENPSGSTAVILLLQHIHDMFMKKPNSPLYHIYHLQKKKEYIR